MNDADPASQPFIPSTKAPAYSPATLAVHADDVLNTGVTDVAPSLHVSTTFRYSSDPEALIPAGSEHASSDRNPFDASMNESHVYSRESAPNTTRLEAILSKLLHAPVLSYACGLAAFNALLVHLQPKVVAIGAGYHGCHGVLHVYQRLTGCKIVNLHDETTWGSLGKGDVVHLETPLNPTGEAYNIAKFAALAHDRGAWLTLDATFAPPPLLDPWAFGADFVMHSGTKYFGGHSDMLCGVIAISQAIPDWQKHYWGMNEDRMHLGAIMGNLESWLGVRSLRTLELRVARQSQNATELVSWLSSLLLSDSKDGDAALIQKSVVKLQHASLQHDDMDWLKKQMPNGFGPVFAFCMRDAASARRLPSKLELFHHATSLGGVESLIEWRRMSDDTVDERLLRVSVGVENIEDLKADLLAGFKALAQE